MHGVEPQHVADLAAGDAFEQPVFANDAPYRWFGIVGEMGLPIE